MKLTAQEEYGLRCLVQIARGSPSASPVTIRDVAEAEGLSIDYAAKLLRILRKAGLLDSVRGASGGFRLALPAEEIPLSAVMHALDTPLYGGSEFCEAHSGRLTSCVHTSTCTVRVVWRAVESAMATVLGEVSLADLLLPADDLENRITMGRTPAPEGA